MDISEIRQGIALLPTTAQSKPLLDALLTLVEPLLSNPHAPTLAAMRQEIDTTLKMHQEHPLGLCYEATCDSCMAQGQDLVSKGREMGREAVQSDIDTALMWYGGPVWHDKVTRVVQKWLAEGRPQPGSAPAFTSASVPESELNIALE